MRKITLLLACLAAASSLSAKQVTVNEAIARFNSQFSTLSPAKVAKTTTKAGTKTIFAADKSAALYLYNSGKTTIVLPADDRVTPLLGYFDTPLTGEMPESVEHWLNEYARQISYLRELPEASAQALSRTSDYEPIAPMGTALWGETAPYSNLLPEVNGGSPAVGPVAVCAAIVMEHYRYPQQATGSVSYDDSGTTREMNLAEKPFDWANILNDYSGEYTDDQANAVAYLAKACAYATHTEFTRNSSSYPSLLVKPLINNFGYSDDIDLLRRDYYDHATWEKLIYDNLKTVGPVPYGGGNEYSGFDFVIDGYEADGYFHINWGLNGYANGYFKLDLLNVYGENQYGDAGWNSYTLDQDAILNVTPQGNHTIALPDVCPLYWAGDLVASLSRDGTLVLAHDTSAYNDFSIYNSTHKYTQFDVCLKAYNQETKETTILSDAQTLSFTLDIYDGKDSGIDSLKFNFESGTALAKGTYTFSPVARVSGTTEWKELQHQHGYTNEFTVNIDKNGNISSVNNAASKWPTIENLKVDSKLILEQGKFFYSFDVKNVADEDVTFAYVPRIFTFNTTDNSFRQMAYGDNFTLSLKAGEERHVSYLSDITVENENDSDYLGTAYLALQNTVTRQLSGIAAVTVEATPTTKLYVSCDNLAVTYDKADPANLSISFKATCDTGYFFSQFAVFIDNEDDEDLDYFVDENVYCLYEGESVSAVLTRRFEDFAYNTPYTIYLCYLGDEDNAYIIDYCDITISENSGIATINDDEAIRVAVNRTDDTVIVTAPSAISRIAVYGIDGRAIDINTNININGTSASASLPNDISLIKVSLTNGKSRVIKLRR